MDMFEEMMKSNFTGMCEEDMENRIKSKLENGNVRTCSMVMENGDVMKCSQLMEKCGGKTCGQAMKKQVKPDMEKTDYKNLVLETVEMPKALVAQMFMDVHALAQMHENLIEMYEVESQLKKQHKAYLHVRERAEKMCKSDKADLNEILDHYEHPGKYIDQALEIYADMIGEEMEEGAMKEETIKKMEEKVMEEERVPVTSYAELKSKMKKEEEAKAEFFAPEVFMKMMNDIQSLLRMIEILNTVIYRIREGREDAINIDFWISRSYLLAEDVENRWGRIMILDGLN